MTSTGKIPWNKGTKGVMRPNKTSFKKGDKGHLGYKHSEETKIKSGLAISKALKGRNFGYKFEKGNKVNLGRVNKEHIEKLAKINWKGGLTVVQKQEIKAGRKKPSQCELCGRGGKICFDHDHTTGKFRGWICQNCNSALGMIKDNVQTLKLMIEYISNDK